MKLNALLRKDICVLIKQMRLFLVFIVLFSIMPGTSLNTFAIIYSAMLPYSAMSYDAHSHWDDLAAMMPYSVWELVVSKYLLGWLFIAGASALSICAQLAAAPLLHSRFDLGMILSGFGLGGVLLALTLPLMFRFGVERGRMIFLLAICCGGGALAAFATRAAENGAALFADADLLLPLAAAALTAVSVPVSVKLYRRAR